MRNKPYPYNEVYEISSFREMLDHTSESFGDSTAFWYKKRKDVVKISYKQLKSDVEGFGTYLLSKGYKNTHIAVLGENSYMWIVAYLAIVCSGNVVVPLDKESEKEDIGKYLERSDTQIIVHTDMYSEEAEFEGVTALNTKDFEEYIKEGNKLIANGDTSYANVPLDVKKTAAIVFTSGTTSAPKGVMLSEYNIVRDIVISVKNLDVPKGTISLLPFYHTFGFMACVLCQIYLGSPVYITGSLKRVLEDIQFSKPKHVAAVPMLVITMYNRIWQTAKESGKDKLLRVMIKISNALLKVRIDLRRKFFKSVIEAFGGELELLITGGSAIDEKYIKGFRDFGITVANGYGITECSPIIATMRNKHFAPASVGTVHSGLEARIVDGEIQVKGETVFMGYYKDEESTKEAFDGEWFKTGDLGYLDEDGLLYVTGRLKNLIILSNGKNVSPEEIENILSEQISNINEVVVYGENDLITAEIFAEDRDGIEEKISEINKTLPAFKQVKKVVFRDTEFEKTTTKKIKRSK